MTLASHDEPAVILNEENRPDACFAAPLAVSTGLNDRCLGDIEDDLLNDWLETQHEDGPSPTHDALRAYSDAWIRFGSKSKADRFRSQQVLTFTNYGAVSVGSPIDWLLGSDGQANLSWQLHSFFFLRDFVASHQITQDDYYLTAADSLIESWMDCALVQKPRPRFAWNDHSTAYRLLALTQYFTYVQTADKSNRNRLATLYRLIVRHQAVLLCRSLYSRGTNHGLDQSFYLYLSTVQLPAHSETKKVHDIALERFRYELACSFAEDGAHVENSPEYHDLILYSTSVMTEIVTAVEGSGTEFEELAARLTRGIAFLAYLVRPDGVLPTIGDTTQVTPRSKHERLASAPAYPSFLYAISRGAEGQDTLPDSAVFPVSGYAIIRSSSPKSSAGRMHLVFKCGFLSTYHRHDDDNSFVLYAAGEDWLVDAGLFRHEERDPQRIYMRSAAAHNILVPVGVEASRNIGLVKSRIIKYDAAFGCVEVTGETTMFPGFRYSRRLVYDEDQGLELIDSYTETESQSADRKDYELALHVPTDKQLEIGQREVRITSLVTGKYLEILVDPQGLTSITVVPVLEGSPRGRRSVVYDKIEPVQTIVLRYSAQESPTIRTQIDLKSLLHGPVRNA